MLEFHPGSTSRWRRAPDNGTLRTIAAPANGACRLERGRIHSSARSPDAGHAPGKIAAAADAGDVLDVGAARPGRGLAGRLAAAGRDDRDVAAGGTRRARQRRRPLDLLLRLADVGPWLSLRRGQACGCRRLSAPLYAEDQYRPRFARVPGADAVA